MVTVVLHLWGRSCSRTWVDSTHGSSLDVKAPSPTGVEEAQFIAGRRDEVIDVWVVGSMFWAGGR